jgi:hypothetical protein
MKLIMCLIYHFIRCLFVTNIQIIRLLICKMKSEFYSHEIFVGYAEIIPKLSKDYIYSYTTCGVTDQLISYCLWYLFDPSVLFIGTNWEWEFSESLLDILMKSYRSDQGIFIVSIFSWSRWHEDLNRYFMDNWLCSYVVW